MPLQEEQGQCSLARLLLLGDPAGALPFSCVLRWAREFWMAAGSAPPLAALARRELREAWARCSAC